MKNKKTYPVLKLLIVIFLAVTVVLLLLNHLIMPWYVSASEVVVPKVVGLPINSALTLLDESGFEAIISDTTFDANFPSGSVLYQKPAAGKTVKEGRRIHVIVNGGEPSIAIPELTGKSLIDATLVLERLGLKLGRVSNIKSKIPKDVIVEQQYAVGTLVLAGTTVDITISGGEPSGDIEVPLVIGKTLSEAKSILTENNLQIGRLTYRPSGELLPNTVMEQYPSSGKLVNKGAVVDLFISSELDQEQEAQIPEEEITPPTSDSTNTGTDF